jgi:HAD superfamily hydrolase (TIGR01509 family)
MPGSYFSPVELSAIRAVVFDFDGLILETEGPVFTAWQEAFAEHGCAPLTVEEWAAEIGSVGALDIVGMLHERATRPVDEPRMHARRRARYAELIAREVVRPGVEAWFDEADSLGLEIAIASSSPIEWVGKHLGRLGLRHRFAHVACNGSGIAAKPAPDVYLAACAALRVAPEAALAVEDSPNGVTAAKAAGLFCVAVPHAITAQLDLSHADAILPSLADTSLREVIAAL